MASSFWNLQHLQCLPSDMISGSEHHCWAVGGGTRAENMGDQGLVKAWCQCWGLVMAAQSMKRSRNSQNCWEGWLECKLWWFQFCFGDEITLISCFTFNIIYSIDCHKVYLRCAGFVKVQPPTAGSLVVFSLLLLLLGISLSLVSHSWTSPNPVLF